MSHSKKAAMPQEIATDPKTDPKPDEPSVPPQILRPIVVGIGASAGGLEALQQLLEALPPDTGLCFVHIQHLDPQRKSLMAELLASATRMRVAQITDGTEVEPN